MAEEEFLLYPLDTGEDPACLPCAVKMVLSVHEMRTNKPDFLTFRCPQCGKTEKYVTE
jgi:hypothetical protein